MIIKELRANDDEYRQFIFKEDMDLVTYIHFMTKQLHNLNIFKKIKLLFKCIRGKDENDSLYISDLEDYDDSKDYVLPLVINEDKQFRRFLLFIILVGLSYSKKRQITEDVYKQRVVLENL